MVDLKKSELYDLYGEPEIVTIIKKTRRNVHEFRKIEQ